MAQFTIANGNMHSISEKMGTIPDVSGALQDYFQAMTFNEVTKSIQGFELQETDNPINFRGVVIPFADRQLLMKPEGQRAWSWYLVYADPSLTLDVDDVVIWKNKQTRVMARKDYSIYGYQEYHLVQDWTGAGP
jgi:hypothetical protein